ncbi:DUF1540 domain-containing protein [Clostridium sardiniense]|uniref:DUF1540 domain-containing protein n=1 Tax=Clostridium sardiniense TaxID=29369 RepID=UPI003D341222
MATLRCGVIECVHNQDNKCCNHSIHVGGGESRSSAETVCDNFDEKELSMQSGIGCGSAGQPNPNMAIGCDVTNCMHNEGQRCVSSYVDIAVESLSNDGHAQCLSFTERQRR